jgi:hypothetical protein
MSFYITDLHRMIGGDLTIELGMIAMRHTNIDDELSERGEYSLYLTNGLWRVMRGQGSIILGRFDYLEDYFNKIRDEIVNTVFLERIEINNRNDCIFRCSNQIKIEFFLGESNNNNENGVEILDPNGIEISDSNIFNSLCIKG